MIEGDKIGRILRRRKSVDTKTSSQTPEGITLPLKEDVDSLIASLFPNENTYRIEVKIPLTLDWQDHMPLNFDMLPPTIKSSTLDALTIDRNMLPESPFLNITFEFYNSEKDLSSALSFNYGDDNIKIETEYVNTQGDKLHERESQRSFVPQKLRMGRFLEAVQLILAVREEKRKIG
jgi:hypothetical protein